MAATARRLVFTYRGDRIELKAAADVAAIAPRSNDVGDAVPRSAFYYELQDEGGGVLYRRRRTSPISTTLEVPTGEASRPFENLPAAGEMEGAFSVLVPAHPDGAFVELFGTDDGLIGSPSVSIGRFDLRVARTSFAPPLPPRTP